LTAPQVNEWMKSSTPLLLVNVYKQLRYFAPNTSTCGTDN